MTEPIVRPRVWDEIWQGRSPDPLVVASVAAAERAVLGAAGASAVAHEMAASVLGAGPLEPVLAWTGLTDLAVNADGSVWADTGQGMRQTDVIVGDRRACRALAQRLAALAGKRLDEATAYVDGVLPSGLRLHAILPPLAPEGTHITLRIPAAKPLLLDDLVASGMVCPEWVGHLQAMMRRRVSFLVSGGTGAGKTTLLAALLAASDPGDRVVVVEDVRELRVQHPHVVHLEGRPANVEGVGEVTMVALVRQSLRMRPDRIVVGEVRGAEVRELLAALNTGHDGGCGTLHANAAGHVVARLEALGALASMSLTAVHAQARSGVQAVLHVRRRADGLRVLDSVGVVMPSEGDDGMGRPLVRPALSLSGGVDPAAAREWARLVGEAEP
ncbi:MAG TPA: TadA family conjugal transfer-associated ATPase [Dermatophilaceae bacterium]|nr:TadA family conjugal transfer-associated ATPase [Dermatophilaceae bacterium]